MRKGREGREGREGLKCGWWRSSERFGDGRAFVRSWVREGGGEERSPRGGGEYVDRSDLERKRKREETRRAKRERDLEDERDARADRNSWPSADSEGCERAVGVLRLARVLLHFPFPSPSCCVCRELSSARAE